MASTVERLKKALKKPKESDGLIEDLRDYDLYNSPDTPYGECFL